jgi:hypothetical protein
MPNFTVGDLVVDGQFPEDGYVWFVLDCEDGTSIVSAHNPQNVCLVRVRKQEERGQNPEYPMRYASTEHLQFLPD